MKFQCDGYEVGLTFFFKRPYVKNIQSGTKRTIPRPVMDKYNQCIDYIMRVDLRQSEREFSVNYVTLRMVDAVFHPDELGAAMFLSQSAKQTVDAALHAILSEMTAELNAQMGPDALMRRISDRPKD